MFNWNEEVPDPDEHELTPTSSRNYKKRANGPWVVEVYLDKNHSRFIEVMDRTSETLTNVIKNYMQDGSVIVTDKWIRHNRLENNGCI